MNILTIVISAMAIIITIKYVLYRRQIKDICRQLAFFRENVTNGRLRTFIMKPELCELTELIDEIYDRHEQSELTLKNKEQHMKEMIANLSHDIRTPLTSLKGYFHLLMQENEKTQNDTEMEYAEIMNERMNTLNDLLDELFTYTKLQDEDYVLEQKTYDMTKLMLDTLFSFYGIFKQKGIEPKICIDEISVMVKCNEMAVKRIFANIIRNAMLHGNGDIEIKYGRVYDEVCFSCSNKVSNPDDIEIDMVFDRFYKADKSRSRATTGLGLAIAKELVERMDGRIEAYLTGDVFEIKVWLPA